MYKKIRVLKVLGKDKSKEFWICSDENPKDEEDKNSFFKLGNTSEDIKKGDVVEGENIRIGIFKAFLISIFSFGIIAKPEAFSRKTYKFIKHYE